jgi:hypothetical protein
MEDEPADRAAAAAGCVLRGCRDHALLERGRARQVHQDAAADRAGHVHRVAVAGSGGEDRGQVISADRCRRGGDVHQAALVRHHELGEEIQGAGPRPRSGGSSACRRVIRAGNCNDLVARIAFDRYLTSLHEVFE